MRWTFRMASRLASKVVIFTTMHGSNRGELSDPRGFYRINDYGQFREEYDMVEYTLILEFIKISVEAAIMCLDGRCCER